MLKQYSTRAQQTSAIQQANIFDVARKPTGEQINGEDAYYYEKSFSFPGGSKQVLSEDREAHTASMPFCATLMCPCHWQDDDSLHLLMQLVRDYIISDEEARAIFYGKKPLRGEEAPSYSH